MFRAAPLFQLIRPGPTEWVSALLWLASVVYASNHIWQSNANNLARVLWTLAVAFLAWPCGFVLWLIFGPRAGR